MTKNVLINWWIVQDASEPWQTGLQDMATAVGEEINNFHDRVLFYIFVIAIAVLWVIMEIIKEYSGRKISHKYANHGTTLEIIWTITPALILITIAFPSFRLLYLLDEVIDPAITVKVIGHQWYWSYEYSDYGGENVETISYDSYMIPTEDLNTGDLRLLEVDNSVVLPVNTHISTYICIYLHTHTYIYIYLHAHTLAAGLQLFRTYVRALLNVFHTSIIFLPILIHPCECLYIYIHVSIFIRRRVIIVCT